MSSGDISTLVSIIGNAANVIESHYKQSPKPYVPSLEDTDGHPYDDELSPLDVKRAIQTLEGACAQLCATLAGPKHTIFNRFTLFYQTACLGVVMNAKVADILMDHPNGLHVSQLGEQCGVQADKLARILRLLCSNHVFREVDEDVFANNRLSMQLLSSNALTNIGIQYADENMKSASVLSETLLDPELGQSESPVHTAFNRFFNYPKSLWTYYEGIDSEEGGVRGRRFAKAMVGFNSAVQTMTIIRDFPWASYPNGTIVDDVAGGWGHVSMELVKRYPNLNVILQDLPERVAMAKTEVWPKECPEAIQNGKIDFKPINFLEQSPVANCDVYILKSIIHNWPDAETVAILTNIRKAMKPTSRLLIHEFIIQNAHRVPDKESKSIQAPEPLLPNYGVGRSRQYNLDIGMLVMMNAQERRVEHHIKLGAIAGLRFVKLWEMGEMDIVEFAPAL